MSIYVISPRNTTTNNPDDPSKIIDTTSRSIVPWSRGLSPFYLGPVKLYGDYVAQCVENGWQYTKIYDMYVDVDGNPTDKYWKWAQAGWNNKRAIRYPMGMNVKPLYSLWDGERLGYVEARKKIYLPLYSNAVRGTEAYKKLEGIYKSEQDIWLSAFDSYNLTPGKFKYEDLLNNPNIKFGHGYVLAMMLEGCL
jgi:hypothetical protein